MYSIEIRMNLKFKEYQLSTASDNVSHLYILSVLIANFIQVSIKLKVHITHLYAVVLFPEWYFCLNQISKYTQKENYLQ